MSGENALFALQCGIVTGGIASVILSLVLAFLKKGEAPAIALASAAVFVVSLWLGYDFVRILGSV